MSSGELRLINCYEEGWIEQLLQKITKEQERGNTTFLLIDSAFSQKCFNTLKACPDRIRWHALFSALPGADDETLALSPTLTQLSGINISDLRAIFSHTEGRPMLSRIVTEESFDQLVQRLTPWCVIDVDGQNLVLRFADTRCLPNIVSALTPEQHGQLFGSAKSWEYVGRSAEWINLPLPAQPRKPTDKVKFSDKQCARLISSSESDEIFENLRKTNPDLLKEFDPATGHEKITFALKLADQYRIEKHYDRLAFAELLMEYPRLEKHQSFHEHLEKICSGEREFDHAIGNLRGMVT